MRSLTLVPRSLLLHRTETLATQVNFQLKRILFAVQLIHAYFGVEFGKALYCRVRKARKYSLLEHIISPGHCTGLLASMLINWARVS